MTALLLIIPTLCYALASGMYALKSNWPLAITYAGYSCANIGLIWLDQMQAR